MFHLTKPLHDSLFGGLGNDSLNGGDGDDIYGINVATDVIQDTSGNDTVNVNFSNGGNYTMAESVENAVLLAGNYSINVTGNALGNTLLGNAGNNIIVGMEGNDSLAGGLGNDVLGGGIGNDTLDGGEGSDIYTVADVTHKTQAETNDTGLLGIDELRFISQLAGSTLTVYAGDTGLEKVVIGTGLATTADSTSNVALNVNASAAANALTIMGNAGANTIIGGAGNDILYGDAGDDILIGGLGNDSLFGGLGSDTLNGGDGDDIYGINVATDVIQDTSGIDTVNVNFSTGGNYTMAESIENAILLAGNYAINVTGNALNNNLLGNIGNNTLNGGAGNDTLTGGLGEDTFTWKLADKGANGLPSMDKITDFNSSQDKLHLRDLLSGENSGNLLNFLDVTTSVTGGVTNTEIRISNTGGFTSGNYSAGAENQHITLTGVNLLAGTNETDLLANLIAQNKLMIDV